MLKYMIKAKNAFNSQNFFEIIFVFILLSLFFSSIYYIFCDSEKDFSGKSHHKKGINNFIECFQFTVVTTSTIGYGDIHPKSIKCRLINILNIIVDFYVMLVIIPTLV